MLEKGSVARTKLSSRAGKDIRKAKQCLLFFYPAGQEILKGKQKVVYCLVLDSLKGKTKRCVLYVYPPGKGSLKEAKKVIDCSIWQGRKKINLNVPITTKVVCFFPPAEMFKKPLWQTEWTQIRLLL